MPNTKKRERRKANSNVNTEFQSSQVVPLTDEPANEPTNEITNELKIQGNLSKKEIEILQKEFFDSVKNNNLDKLQFFLRFRDYVDINIPNTDGRTALMWAAWYGYTDICKLLIEHGADVNLQDNKNGRTALIFAAWSGCTEICKFLIEKGADVDLPANYGWTALMFAAGDRRTDTCKLLVELGADVNMRSKNGNTALMEAALNGHTETVEYLLSVGPNPLFVGVNPNLTQEYGKTAYDFAKNEEIKQILKEYMKIWKLWELIGKENAIPIQQSVKNCAPSRVEEIFKSL